jgi:hypothetical protein
MTSAPTSSGLFFRIGALCDEGTAVWADEIKRYHDADRKRHLWNTFNWGKRD